MNTPSTALFGDLVLMVDIFASCIEAGVLPTRGSPCHHKARQLVNKSNRSDIGLPGFEKIVRAIDRFEKRSRKAKIVVKANAWLDRQENAR